MSDDLESMYQKTQFYLQKNILDLQIPAVAEGMGLASNETRTPCGIFWGSPCEVSHAAIRVNIEHAGYGDFTFDPIRFIEVYTCSGYWAANFLMLKPVEPLTPEEELASEDRTKRVVQRMSEMVRLRWHLYDNPKDFESAAKLAVLEREDELAKKEIEEASELDFSTRLIVVGAARLWKVAKSPMSDAAWLRELIWELLHRKISLFDPRLKIDWTATYFHEPIPDPYLDPPPSYSETWGRIAQETLEKLNNYFHVAR